MLRSGFQLATAAGSQRASSMSGGSTASPSTGARRRRSNASSLRARAPRLSPWCAPRRQALRRAAGEGRRRRCARALRRQSKRRDYVRGGAPAWDRAGSAFASGLSLHARWGCGWGRVSVVLRSSQKLVHHLVCLTPNRPLQFCSFGVQAGGLFGQFRNLVLLLRRQASDWDVLDVARVDMGY